MINMKEPVFSEAKFAKIARSAVAEGIVMLKNDDAVLPLPAGSRIAIFGRSQFNYYKSGTGSGGLVNARYVVGIPDALETDPRFIIDPEVKAAYTQWLQDHPFDPGSHWASEPWHQEEMTLDADFVSSAAQRNDAAIIIIGRTAGEDQDNKNEPGSYLLTPQEETMLQIVCSTFSKTVVLLNTGNIMDMRWVNTYAPSSVLYVWQGGQEGGNGVLDVLSGDVSPSGKLPDTIAYHIEDYPSAQNFGNDTENIYSEDIYVGYRYFETFAKEKVQYPFGFGLSYTSFALSDSAFTFDKDAQIHVTVKNTGVYSGKEVVQVYIQAPEGLLGKPARVLGGFGKTRLLAPGEEESLTVSVSRRCFASFDDSGITGYSNAFVLESGDYIFYAGTDVRSAAPIGSFSLPETILVEQCEEAMAPTKPFTRLECKNGQPVYAPVPLQSVSPDARRFERILTEIPQTGDLGYKLSDVASGNITMEQFIAQLSDSDLCCIVRGEGMNPSGVTPGIAGAFGGVTTRLSNFGIPKAACSDGPCGIRIDCGTIAFAMPNGTCLASTFNEELLTTLYEMEGLELRKNHVDTLLGPGINIHRNPLNGRNFEYFSEDPLLTGKMASAQLRGMHHYGVTGTIKHFACNNQEHQRSLVDAVVSQRALREIYLRSFELAVREGGAYSIMTSYNPINGWWTASNYDLLTTILRNQWGYTGLVMTDWWAKGNDAGKPGDVTNTAAMIRAQNDLFMVTADPEHNSGKDNSEECLKIGTVSRAEFQRSAMNICRNLLKMPAYRHLLGESDALDAALAAVSEPEDASSIPDIPPISVGDSVTLPGHLIDTTKGKTSFLVLDVQTAGDYNLELSARTSAETPELAQLSFAVFKGNQLLQTVTLIGQEKTWKTCTIPFRVNSTDRFYLKLHFAQAGIEIGGGRIARVM